MLDTSALTPAPSPFGGGETLPSPFGGRVGDEGQLTETEITQRLAEAQNVIQEDEFIEKAMVLHSPRPAAVLIPFIHRPEPGSRAKSWQILLTRRTDHLPEHSGQVAFPGGRMDAEDSCPEDTALRETHEEIGLHPQDVHILGKLHPIPTVTNYNVTPVVGVISASYPFRPHPVEVSRIFTIPLDWLADPNNHVVCRRVLPGTNIELPVIYFSSYDGELLWGVSAHIMLNLLKALGI